MPAVVDCPSCALQFHPRPGAPADEVRCPRCGTAVGAAAEFQCSACGGMFDVDHVYDEGGGQVICHACYAKRAAATATAAVAPAGAARSARSAGHAPTHAAAASPGKVAAMSRDGGKAVDAGAPPAKPKKKTSSNRGLLIVAGGVAGVAAAIAVAVMVMRPATSGDQTVQSDSGDAAGPASSDGPERNLARVNRLWREARDRTRQRDSSGAAAKYAEMFNAIESDTAISGNRSLMADLDPARREWELANDAAGLPPLSDKQRGRAATVARPVAAGKAPPAAADAGAGAAIASDDTKPAGDAGDDGGPGGTRAAASADAEEMPEDAETPKAEVADAEDAQSDGEADRGPSPKARAAAPKRKTSVKGGAAAAPADEAEVAAMLDEAERLDGAGEKPAALARYTEAFRAVGDRSSVRDPALRKRLAKALTTRASLIGQLRGGEAMRKLTLESLMAAGAEALETGKWQAALDSLADAKQVVEARSKPAERNADPQYIDALHGMAVAYLKLKKNPKAGELFDDKAPLGRASLNSPDREMVWNRAVIDMIQKYKIMRAVKGLKEYFDRNPNDNPEDMVNLFGTALYTAYKQFEDDEKKPPPLLVQAISVYELRERGLEADRPGQKRWGIRWISEGEFNQKMDETRRLEAEIRQLRENALPAAKRQVAEEERGHPVRVRGSRRVRYVVNQAALAEARARLKRVRADIEAARAKIPQRDWLATYEPVVPELGTPTALASAAGPSRGSPGGTRNAPGGSNRGNNGDGGPMLPPPPAPEPRPQPPAPEPGPSVADATPPRAVDPPAPAVPARRRVQRYAAAFPVDRTRLITAAAPLGEADTVFIEDSQGGAMRARVVARNEQLALLEVDADSVNGGMPYLNLSAGFAGGTLRCAGLPTPTLFGPAVETIEGRAGRPPEGDAGWTVSLPRHPRLAGAPLIDAGDQTVVGMVTGARDDPSTQLPAIAVTQIRAFLTESNAVPAAPCANPDPTAVYQVTIEE